MPSSAKELAGALRRLGVALAALAVFAGCADPEGLPLGEWTLVEGGVEPDAVVELPGDLGDELSPEAPAYALRNRVVLPEAWQGRALSLDIPYFLARTRLEVDGQHLQPRDARRHDQYRGTGTQSWVIPAELTRAPSIEVVLRVRYTWEQAGWLYTVPRLTAGAGGDPWSHFVATFNDWAGAAAVGVLFTTSFCCFVLFWSERSLRVYASLSLQTISTMSFPVFSLGISQVFFGSYDLLAMVLLLSVASTAAVFTTHYGTGLPRPTWWWCVPAALSALVLIPTYDGFGISTFEGPLVVSLVGGATTYQVILLTRLLRERPDDTTVKMHLLGWAVFIPFFPTEAALWLNLGDFANGLRVGNVGAVAYALVHFVAISRTLIMLRRDSDRLNAALASKMASIEHLNQELRRQVGERSRELATAIGRLSGLAECPMPVAGDVVDDRYRIVEPIGSGAMGSVFKCQRESDAQLLAMKVLAKVGHPRNLARFARESQLVSELHHPNVVSIVDVAVSRTGFMYMVMEYVPGASLKKRGDRFGDIPWAMDVLAGVARGLAAIHARGVVHRDIKPDNVLVVEGQAGLEVKITDFGISTLASTTADEVEPKRPATEDTLDTRTLMRTSMASLRSSNPFAVLDLTETGAFLGTPLYMAPEVVREEEPDASADIFSLGVLAFEMIAGTRPYELAPAIESLHGRPAPPVKQLTEVAENVDAEVAGAVMAALSLEAEERPSAESLADLFAARAEARRRPRPRTARESV